ncbi:hypothetical protein K8R43_05665 [archaeon]|nr:hypothetical protein [archaeon]
METIVCDASPLISLAETGLLNILPKLNAKFVIPKGVEVEIVHKPLKVNQFQLNALRLNKAILDGSITTIDDNKVKQNAQDILDEANSLFQPRMHILHRGEAECLALLEQTNSRTLLVDERTTRLLVEDPHALGEFIQRRTHSKAQLNENKAESISKRFSKINVIRSCELAAFAYRKGMFKDLGNGQLLHACLYALKYSGCAITNKEIKQYLELLS